MAGIKKKCFVCEKEFAPEELTLNNEVNLLVCAGCKGTLKETVAELLDSLADGLVCGCI